MFVHVPAAWVALFSYAVLGAIELRLTCFSDTLLADLAAKRRLRRSGAAFTLMALITGSFWGRPMWGAWWVWGDARLVSMLVLSFAFPGVHGPARGSIDDEARAARAAEILAIVGLINLPVIKFSVDWWNTLHQGESIMRAGGPTRWRPSI